MSKANAFNVSMRDHPLKEGWYLVTQEVQGPGDASGGTNQTYITIPARKGLLTHLHILSAAMMHTGLAITGMEWTVSSHVDGMASLPDWFAVPVQVGLLKGIPYKDSPIGYECYSDTDIYVAGTVDNVDTALLYIELQAEVQYVERKLSS